MSKTSRQSIAPSANTQIDFKVDPKTGVGNNSQRKTAELLGIPRSTLNDWVRKNSDALNTNEVNHLDDKTFIKAVIFGRSKGSQKAELVNNQLLEAGARAYIYYHAGVQVQTTSNKLHEPCVPIRWLAQQLGRSRSSVDRTINVSIKRLREYVVSTEVQYVSGERCVSPALILCCMFTGKQMQAARGWLLTLAETDALPAPEVLLQLTSPIV